MSDTIFRYMAMLALIPVRPGKIAASVVHEKLAALGYETNIRSVERDLHKLGDRFGFICDGFKPAGWSWLKRDKRMTFPPLNTETALTYELLSRYLAPILPRRMLKLLEPEFAQARRALEELRCAPIGRWSRRIAVLPNGQQLLPPEVKAEVTDVVYDALLMERRFAAHYRAIGADAATRHVFNPLGLVYREGVLYLVATVAKYVDPRHFALQRMSNAQSLEEAAVLPHGFDFEHYIREEKSFDYPIGSDIKLELIVDAGIAHHLGECRLSADQTINPIHGSDESRVSATVADTDKLLWWLRSLGPSIEVVRPTALRRKMAAQVRELAAIYGLKRIG